LGVGDFDEEFVVALVVEVDDDGVFGVMDVPEDALAVLIEGARGDDAGKVRAGHFDAVIPTAGGFGVEAYAGDVGERDFERAFEGPELVGAADVQGEGVLGYGEIYHDEPPGGGSWAGSGADMLQFRAERRKWRVASDEWRVTARKWTAGAELERAGRLLGSLDMRIAVRAVAVDATLVAADRAFARIRSLREEDLMKRDASAG